jgi:hypothetical protein
MKSTPRKLLDASWAQRRALIGAGALLIVARAALVLLPFRTVLRIVARVARPRRGRPDPARLERRVWAVEVMGNRLFPSNPCLTQAILVQVLYRRAGRPAELRIGVKRETQATPQAHAWVESEGTIVIGQSEASRGYVTLPPFRLDG